MKRTDTHIKVKAAMAESPPHNTTRSIPMDKQFGKGNLITGEIATKILAGRERGEASSKGLLEFGERILTFGADNQKVYVTPDNRREPDIESAVLKWADWFGVYTETKQASKTIEIVSRDRRKGLVRVKRGDGAVRVLSMEYLRQEAALNDPRETQDFSHPDHPFLATRRREDLVFARAVLQKLEQAKRPTSKMVSAVEGEAMAMTQTIEMTLNEIAADLHRLGHHGHAAAIEDAVSAMLAGAPKPPEQPRAVQDGWISVADRLPKCSSKPNSFGTCVLIYPNYKSEGASDMPIAFYGRRQTNEPNFYIHGCILNHVTHWMPLPTAPQPKAGS